MRKIDQVKEEIAFLEDHFQKSLEVETSNELIKILDEIQNLKSLQKILEDLDESNKHRPE